MAKLVGGERAPAAGRWRPRAVVHAIPRSPSSRSRPGRSAAPLAPPSQSKGQPEGWVENDTVFVRVGEIWLSLQLGGYAGTSAYRPTLETIAKTIFGRL